MIEDMLKYSALTACLLLLGCGSASLDQKVARNAADRWNCPVDQVKVEKLDGNTYRAHGCDREADYACQSVSGSSAQECDRVSGM